MYSIQLQLYLQYEIYNVQSFVHNKQIYNIELISHRYARTCKQESHFRDPLYQVRNAIRTRINWTWPRCVARNWLPEESGSRS